MTSLLDDLQIPAAIYYDEDFRDCFESCIGAFKNSTNTQVAPVAPYKASTYEGRFFDFLQDARIAKEHHWFIMRLNDMSSPSEFKATTKTILVMSETELDRLISQFRTSTTMQT